MNKHCLRMWPPSVNEVNLIKDGQITKQPFEQCSTITVIESEEPAPSLNERCKPLAVGPNNAECTPSHRSASHHLLRPLLLLLSLLGQTTIVVARRSAFLSLCRRTLTITS